MTVTELNSLDPVQFRVPASDAKGHATRLWFRCQPGHAHQLEMIIQTRRFPYRTKGDLLRHALVRHFHYLEAIAPIPSVTAEVDAILEILRDEEFSSDFIFMFDKLGSQISKHIGEGSVGEARRLLLAVQNRIEGMPDCYWKDKYKSELSTRYGHLISSAPTASLRGRAGAGGDDD